MMQNLRIRIKYLALLVAVMLSACDYSPHGPDSMPMMEPGGAERNVPESGSADAALFEDKCNDCHRAPLPEQHTVGEWPLVVQRMQSHRLSNNLTPLTSEELGRITQYLQRHAQEDT